MLPIFAAALTLVILTCAVTREAESHRYRQTSDTRGLRDERVGGSRRSMKARTVNNFGVNMSIPFPVRLCNFPLGTVALWPWA